MIPKWTKIRMPLLLREYGIKYDIYPSIIIKRFSVAQSSHSFFDSRDPLLPPKRASFFQKKEKWHFLLEKVCHVVNPHYLCIWKRTRGEATILWIVAIAKRRTRLVLVFPECFPLRLRFRRRRKAQDNAAAVTLHKQEFVPMQQTFSRLGIVQTLRDLPSALDLSRTFFDIFAYWFSLRPGEWNLYVSSG